MKCADREHRCKTLRKKHPRYMVMRSIRSPSEPSWEIWIPDFLRSDDTSVKAFVWSIKFCPFCGCDLAKDENSKPI